MTCTCKVFSTLILDSRYFYSQKKKNVSSCCLMLRDSCLYSSLACSVYSICWVIFFLSSFEITCRYLFIIWHNSHSVICSAEYYLCTFFFFLDSQRGEVLIHGEWICEKRNCLLGDSPSCAKAWMWPARSGRLLRSRHSSVTLTLPRPPQGCDF